jgi:hypothetical protein
MKKSRIQQVIESMDPPEAAVEMADAAKKLLSILREGAVRNFLARLSRDEAQDKIAGLVHL